jgi:hypothetical protein
MSGDALVQAFPGRLPAAPGRGLSVIAKGSGPVSGVKPFVITGPERRSARFAKNVPPAGACPAHHIAAGRHAADSIYLGTLTRCPWV